MRDQGRQQLEALLLQRRRRPQRSNELLRKAAEGRPSVVLELRLQMQKSSNVQPDVFDDEWYKAQGYERIRGYAWELGRAEMTTRMWISDNVG